MKRYIEIVYNNSGSMTEHIGNRTKYEIAQGLFEKEILPTLAMKGATQGYERLHAKRYASAKKTQGDSLPT